MKSSRPSEKAAWERCIGRRIRSWDARLRLRFSRTRLATIRSGLRDSSSEARAAAALNHPNICAIHEVGDHEGQPFIVMELLRGQTLEARLSSQGRLECDEVLELSTQLADALDAAHTAGIVHRDVKPANIFITDRGQAKILDFGLAKTNSLKAAEALTISRDVGQLTGDGTTLGTLAYMSPEQALGKELDPRTDLFSLGAVIYEALTGKPPFIGATPAAIFDQILNRAPTAPVQLNPEVAPGLEGVVKKLLDKDVDLRYQHASELRADLKRMRRDTDSGHRPPAASLGGAARWSALKVTGAAALGALALVAVVWSARSVVGPAPAGTSAPALAISPLTDTEGLSLSGSWSPDGTQVAYDYTLNGSMDVAVMSLGGGEPRLVAGGPNDEAMPRWSPDGSRIAFLSDDGTGMNVYWVPPTGGARRRIAQTHLQYLDRFTSIGAVGSQPWSPDGRRLVFSRLEPTHSVALWTVDIESGQEARLTAPPAGASDWRAAWSHDGKWIAFSRSRDRLVIQCVSRAGIGRGTARGAPGRDGHPRFCNLVARRPPPSVRCSRGSVRRRRLGGRNRNREDPAADGRGESQYPDPLLHRAHRFLAMEP